MRVPVKYSFRALSVACLGLLVGCMESQKSADQTAQESPAYRIGADALYAEYQANQVAADQKYKGQVVVVSGTIRDIGKDLMDQPYIQLGKSALLGVKCTFVKSDSSPIANLQKGQSVTVKGRVAGQIVDVMIKDCSLL
jgi:hypothetical protein